MLYSNEIFMVVKKYIDEMDYYTLLSGGAPKDEFDGETRKICNKMTPNTTVEELAAIIAEVFEKNFDNPEKPQTFLYIAEKIKHEI